MLDELISYLIKLDFKSIFHNNRWKKVLIGILIFIVLLVISRLIPAIKENKEIDFEKFNNMIIVVEQKIAEVHTNYMELAGEKVDVLLSNSKYKKHIEKINKEYNVNVLSEGYYYLDFKAKEKLGLTQYKDEFIVNYANGEVYCLNPITYKGNIYYTTQQLKDRLLDNYTYKSPIIPEGFKHVEGTWNTGFVIKDGYGNEFVWIPVGYLNEEKPSSKFTWYYKGYMSEPLDTEEYNRIVTSIDKYQGFYIGRYESSLQGATAESEQGKNNILQVVKGVLPISNMSYSTNYESVYKDTPDESARKNLFGYNQEGKLYFNGEIKGALELARDMANEYDWKGVYSTLIYPEHYDTMLYLMNNLEVTNNNLLDEDSSSLGNYMNAEFRYLLNNEMLKKKMYESYLIPTGIKTYELESNTETKRNAMFNIYDLAGNLSEWTMKEDELSIRGGDYSTRGTDAPISPYINRDQTITSALTGIRVVLYID